MDRIRYMSTRGAETQIEASYAILRGIARDGGLYVPDRIPAIDMDIEDMVNMSYQEIAYLVMKDYLSDFTEDELKACINKAYDDKFDTQTIVPVVKKGDITYLELFHGSTIAFKDMALSILPHLMTTSMKKQGIDQEVVILTATSGDTGKAALAGFADVEGTRIIVFYPKDGVSPIQEKQMITQRGDNTYVVSIDGNFDDAQSGVKDIFTNVEFRKMLGENGFRFSSANSINIGRLLPQVVYYFYGYAEMIKQEEIKAGEAINIVVPTGNFGNILAAYYAKKMGLPVNRLICASNDNKVLYDFFRTGIYNRKRDFKLTNSPSMDILISSNLERLLYEMTDFSGAQTEELMAQLNKQGEYVIKNINDFGCFYGNYATEEETSAAIKEVYDETGYIIDPHTAVGYCVYKKFKDETADESKVLLASTASPYKFTKSVMKALDSKYDKVDDLALIDELKDTSGVVVPNAIKEILEEEPRHQRYCEKEDMKKVVANILDIDL